VVREREYREEVEAGLVVVGAVEGEWVVAVTGFVFAEALQSMVVAQGANHLEEECCCGR
jgi:hypothetical protein